MDIKKLFLETEGDAYYQRNKKALTEDNIGEDIKFYSSFFSEMNMLNKNTKFVEIGASNGHNLKYLKEKFVKFLALNLHLKQQKKEINNFLIMKKFYYKALQIPCLMMMNV